MVFVPALSPTFIYLLLSAMGFTGVEGWIIQHGYVVNPWAFLRAVWERFGLYKKLERNPTMTIDASSALYQRIYADDKIPKGTLAKAVEAQQSGNPDCIQRATLELVPFAEGILKSVVHPGINVVIAAESLTP